MNQTGFPPEISRSATEKWTFRALQLTRLRALGKAEGMSQCTIAAAEVSLAEAFALGDFVDAFRHMADGHD